MSKVGVARLTYGLDFDNETKPGDKVAEINGVKVFIDFKSYLYLRAQHCSFSTDPLNGGFSFMKPQCQEKLRAAHLLLRLSFPLCSSLCSL